ncbi:MAG TPA: hypothetical protein VMQ50_02690, partial [Casimicrobiaceae bacterium]|nr:hypothetical protein [Casimicrobiaceae bacterium]
MGRLHGLFTRAIALAAILIAPSAYATYHTFVIQEIFSNADGTIQYIVLHEALGMNGQNLLTGHALTATQGMSTQTYVFPEDLPGGACGYYSCNPSPTANKHVLIATQGFAALNLVTPDYFVPNGFIPLSNGTINYAQVDQVSYNALPTDGVSAIDRNGNVIANLATNFGGRAAAVSAPAASVNYEGLWWAAPAGSESGWGVNLAHQGDTIFASWFTYDLTGKGVWLVMTAAKSAPNTYSGALFTTTGPAFNAVPFNPAQVLATQVGTGTLSFTDANAGSFAYTFPAGGALGNASMISQVKPITHQVFGPLPVCASATGSLAAATNYQDLWWAAPAGSESGWGINLTHQGDTIFASWFTYDLNGSPMWLVVTAPKSSPGVYNGMLFRTTGPALNAVPFNPANVLATQVGTATFSFADGNNANFAYTVNGIAQNKAITR